MYSSVVRRVFPLEFSTAPISDASVEPRRIFKASMYSPLGMSRSSNDLFIRPAMKFLTVYAILLYPLILTTKIH